MVETGDEFDEVEDIDEEDEEEEIHEEEEEDQDGDEELDLMVHFPNGQISFVHTGVNVNEGSGDGSDGVGNAVGDATGNVIGNGTVNFAQGVGYSVFVTFGADETDGGGHDGQGSAN